ncbi:MAG: SelL-related redox protein [Phycisphaerales bacterium JB052]
MQANPALQLVPIWLKRVLILAGLYNIVWGAWVILFPASLFATMDLPSPTYPAIWQCVGMIVGVYGVGYLIAARDPITHWPIILVGLLGKILGPIGFVYAALITGDLPIQFIWTIIPNDLIWWVPFTMLLVLAAKYHQGLNDTGDTTMNLRDAIQSHHDQHGTTLEDLSDQSPVMLVFLRHLGCTFCMETLQDLQSQRDQIESDGIQPVLVHMSDEAAAKNRFAKYALDDLPRIADPDQDLYRAFELKRGSLWQLIGPRVWFQGIRAMFRGNGVGKLQGDGFQMPGVFILHKGKIIKSFKHAAAGDRPEYACMSGECKVPAAQ